jgi:hypothetical protein
MGGIGSGRVWYGGAGGAGGKYATEDFRSIDIRWLKKQGYLKPGISRILSWSITKSDGETKQTGSIIYHMEEDRMILSYRSRVNGGQWAEVEQVIRFDRTPCHFGGFREWFLCPGCGRRVAVLYGAGKLFLCRHCYNLCYTCQQEPEIDRIMRKRHKIRKLVGASDNLTMPIWRKPKGMHQKTFDRLRYKDEKIGMREGMLIMDRFGVGL